MLSARTALSDEEVEVTGEPVRIKPGDIVFEKGRNSVGMERFSTDL